MPYKIDHDSSNNIIVIHYLPPFDFVEEVKGALEAEIAILETWENFPAYVIVELTQVNVSFADLVQALGQVARTEVGQKLNEFELVTMFVGADMAKLAADSVGQDQYGKFDAEFFATLDEAKGWVKEQLVEAK